MLISLGSAKQIVKIKKLGPPLYLLRHFYVKDVMYD